ncbi:MAG: anaerobic carbon-monoxide dehydrogenase iron sulfur subunit [Petroclostridium sp.]|jgi:carbon-monoxide dehydrogenase iron sulfur subunit|uniref:4Fe-4S dicluster domain-containing protein n=1 Tax=Petroclostridium xylanilyticum TaxID=1792311 RepID=UPI000B9821A0|nr:4Fe-4S dicluster domain-containing protein [Petroclostridium xylanilyticum]MBZ4644936.1 4Fe-4S ferredoxin iron-sulfur binding protein [Clostridia bacterium]MDK2810117.1 anaerobic carbon-monoxide dehydrogenase iron sulfur subunit [Petroclostridium sp.]
MKKVYAVEEYCVGCKLCEVHCVVAHSKSKDIIKAYKKENPRPLPRVIVEEDMPVSFALQCRHCEDAPCTKACITGAMHKDEVTGVVTNREERCVGCWTCILVCPYGAIVRNEQDKKVATKCDLCSESGDIPACVKNCPNEALKFEERGE